MSARVKLELTWIGKENRPKLEPRILLEDPEKSHHAAHRVTYHDLFDGLTDRVGRRGHRRADRTGGNVS